MLGELFDIGDKAIVQIPKENRDWGFNPCDDGTIVTVIGFAEIDNGRTCGFQGKPGVIYAW